MAIEWENGLPILTNDSLLSEVPAYTQVLADSIGSGVPPGVVSPFVGAKAPDGWLICDGSPHDDADYPELAAEMHAFQSMWPTDNGVNYANQFLVPDLRGRVPVGQGTDAYSNNVWKSDGSKDAIVVEHSHYVSGHTATDGAHRHGDAAQTAFDVNGWQQLGLHNGHGGGGVNPWQFQNTVGSPLGVNSHASSHYHAINFWSGSAGASGSDKNLQPYFVLLYIIRT